MTDTNKTHFWERMSYDYSNSIPASAEPSGAKIRV